jgi:predicted nucleic acid-binding protein
MTPGDTLGHVSKWFAQPICQTLAPGPAHLRILGTLLSEGQASSRLVTNAHLAALAIEHQAELHSNDSDFGCFSGLKWINPISRY